jgi:hypothetical protein
MTDGRVTFGKFGQLNPATGLKPGSSQSAPEASADPSAEISSGMTVEEEVLRVVSAQIIYQLRCECGRSWFALELPTFVKCPACRKVGMVTL